MTNFSGKNLDNAESVGRKTEHQDDASQRVGLPEGWVETSLDSISSDVSYGYTAKSTTEKVGPHLLRITDIQDNQVDWKAVPFCEIEKGKTDQYLLKADDLVFARTGATVGKSFLIKGNIPESVFASYLIRVRSVKQIGIKYLAHFFNSASYWNQITEFSSGIGQPNVNGTKLKELNLPLAPLAEQQQIAQKLDELLAQVDTLKNRLDAIPNILKRFRQSVLAAAVNGRLTEEWRQIEKLESWIDSTFGELGSVSGGLTKNSKRQSLELFKPYLRVANVHANSFKLDDVTDIGLTEAEFKKTKLEKGDLLIVEGNGSLEHIGRAAIWNGEIEECSHQNHLIRWRAKENVHPKFVLYQLLSPQGRKDLVDVAKSTTGLHTLSISKISSLYLPKVSFEEQTEIVRRVDQLFAYADQIEQRVKDAQARVNHLTQSILAKAFRGELTADWRAQNPELISGENSAAALLERIKAEREAAGKTKRKVKAGVAAKR